MYYSRKKNGSSLRSRIYRLALGALLHDLGLRYITVPYINCDINELSEAEAFEYRKHPILAYSVLEEEKWMDPFVKKWYLYIMREETVPVSVEAENAGYGMWNITGM